MNNYTPIHLHTMLSNPFTTMDSVTGYKDYIDIAKKNNMTAIAFTEHGNVMEWIHKKEYCEREEYTCEDCNTKYDKSLKFCEKCKSENITQTIKPIKYIHGVEAYVTESLDEKIRDNYHVVLLGVNYDGVLEINKLMSHKVACNRQDGHFHYNPRITFDELLNTSNNIIITSACLGGILNKGNKDIALNFVKFMKENKHRCYLEIQHHKVDEQIEYNKKLLKISKATGIPLIIGTDTHSLNKEHAEGRIILQKSKNIHFDNEDGWDTTFKTYEELMDIYREHSYISINELKEAIDNTNKIAELVENFSIDRSNKYPKLYANSEQVFKEKIKEGVVSKKIIDRTDFDKYKKRINHEYKTMKKNDSIDYMLLEEDIKKWCRQNDKPYGYSRGSVSGSLIAYLLDVTKIDSVEYNMNFERFQSPFRRSLCDVDTDYAPSIRKDVKDYIYSKSNLVCCEIVTFNTIALKGAIRDVGRALSMSLNTINEICSGVESMEDKYRKQYPNLFKYVDLLQGVIVSVGTHPAATVVFDAELASRIGTFTLTTCDYPISQINMKEIDSQNFVKLDILGLDTVEVIYNTCKLANIDELTPQNTDYNDMNVWEDIRRNSFGVFQWESDSAFEYYKKLFSEKTLKKILTANPDMSMIDLFSIGNGAIRPAGESYRESLAEGVFNDNGHRALNDFLSPTLGYLVFQEQIIEFLNRFCGYTLGEADLVRRAFSKKIGTDVHIPRIKDGFIKTMRDEYGETKERSEELIVGFLKVIKDASDYLFSLNHSDPYSRIGYACAWLRYYYPVEFMTSKLNAVSGDIDKTFKAIKYIKEETNIVMKSAKFRHSANGYKSDAKNNCIYKGIESVKGFGEKLNVYKELHPLYSKSYNSFIELLKDISCTNIGLGKVGILIEINFFEEFGSIGYLRRVLDMYEKYGTAKVLTKSKFTNQELNRIIPLGRETKSQIRDFNLDEFLSVYSDMLYKDDISTIEKMLLELKHLGYINSTSKKYDDSFHIVSGFEHKYKHPMITLTKINDGTNKTVKCKMPIYSKKPIVVGDVIKVLDVSPEGKWKMTENGGFKQSKTEFEDCLKKYSLVKFMEE